VGFSFFFPPRIKQALGPVYTLEKWGQIKPMTHPQVNSSRKGRGERSLKKKKK